MKQRIDFALQPVSLGPQVPKTEVAAIIARYDKETRL